MAHHLFLLIRKDAWFGAIIDMESLAVEQFASNECGLAAMAGRDHCVAHAGLLSMGLRLESTGGRTCSQSE